MRRLRRAAGAVTAADDLVVDRLACRRGERRIFSGLSFRLPPGGVLVLTGSNGSGKTSLLRILAGLLAPATGELVWGTRPVAADLAGYRARLHYIGHRDAVKAALTPRETLAFWAALRGFGRSRSTPAVGRALALFALDEMADWPCRWLSAGQRRRLALARLIAAPAPLWLLDEPMTALDDDSRQRFETVVAEHRAAGGRIVLSTHAPVAFAGGQGLLLDDFAPADREAGLRCR